MWPFKKKNNEQEYEIKKFTSYLRHNMLDLEEWVVTYKDGRKIRFTVKSLYPLNSIHEEPLFNAYG